VESRMRNLVKETKSGSIRELVQQMMLAPNNGLQDKVVDAMTTNETSFYRDIHPFEAMKNTIFPELIKKRLSTREFNIWCGAASSGQEPYGIAMMIMENFPQITSWNFRYYASDISEEMIQRCREGTFSQLEVNRGLPAPLLVKYFKQKVTKWQIREDLRILINFQLTNLAGDWPHMPRMDIIFMRNVLIYFNPATKIKILGKIKKLLRPDGYLFLGAAETTLNLDNSFERLDIKQSGCYRLRDQ